MKFDNLFLHCSPCISVSLYSQPGKWRLYGDRNVQAEQPRSKLKLSNFMILSSLSVYIDKVISSLFANSQSIQKLRL